MPSQEMFSQPVVTCVLVPHSDIDSRMAVADILSSMANGSDVQTTTYSTLDGMQSGVPTRTTPTITPTTLRTFDQMGYELQTEPTPPHHNQAGFVPPPLLTVCENTASSFVTVDSKTWQGGCTTVVSRPSTTTPAPEMVDCVTTTTHIPPPPPPRRNTGGRRPNNSEKLSPEEAVRRNQRRERNKLAAARCRKRRLDHTNLLLEETDELESLKQRLTMTLQELQSEKEELEFILSAHEPCKRQRNNNNTSSKISYVPMKIESENDNISYVSVKQEPQNNNTSYASLKQNTRNDNQAITRPTSLPVSSHFKRHTEDIGIPLNTPSSCIPNFESLLEGGTGLTPVTPLVTTCPSGSLATPTVSLPESCSNQQRSCSSSSSDLSSPESVNSKLVSL